MGFRASSGYRTVEPAHMELVEPSIRTAFTKCVDAGSQLVVVFPWFLLPGRHWTKDIPDLTAAAAADHFGVHWMVAAPFGLHPDMMNTMNQRIEMCLERAAGTRTACDFCDNGRGCELKTS